MPNETNTQAHIVGLSWMKPILIQHCNICISGDRPLWLQIHGLHLCRGHFCQSWRWWLHQLVLLGQLQQGRRTAHVHPHWVEGWEEKNDFKNFLDKTKRNILTASLQFFNRQTSHSMFQIFSAVPKTAWALYVTLSLSEWVSEWPLLKKRQRHLENTLKERSKILVTFDSKALRQLIRVMRRHDLTKVDIYNDNFI